MVSIPGRCNMLRPQCVLDSDFLLLVRLGADFGDLSIHYSGCLRSFCKVTIWDKNHV